MTIKTVLIDLDGVLANFVQGAIDVHYRDTLYHEIDVWDFPRVVWGMPYFEFVTPMTFAFWARLPAYSWANLVVDSVRKKFSRAKIKFCTRTIHRPGCETGKRFWVNENIRNGSSYGILFSQGDKSEFAGAETLLIDDKNENVDAFREAGGFAILFAQRWNRNRLHASDPVEKLIDSLDWNRALTSPFNGLARLAGLVEFGGSSVEVQHFRKSDQDVEDGTCPEDAQCHACGECVEDGNAHVCGAIPASILPTDATGRKDVPLYDGLFRYFPRALVAIAALSKKGNDQHNPGEPLHWDRTKSADHHNCILRHLIDAGKVDDDGVRHSAKAAWRALAALEVEIEGVDDSV